MSSIYTVMSEKIWTWVCMSKPLQMGINMIPIDSGSGDFRKVFNTVNHKALIQTNLEPSPWNFVDELPKLSADLALTYICYHL